MIDFEDADVAKDTPEGDGHVEFTIGGMPETTVFWNNNDTISVMQYRDREQVIVVVMPEMVERLCEMLRATRDAMHNL
jgi:hypothetical protein